MPCPALAARPDPRTHFSAVCTAEPLPIYAFLDYTSPLSYVTAAALRRIEAEGMAELHPLAFVTERGGDSAALEADAEWEQARDLAAAAGLPLAAPTLLPRTAKAHEAARHADQQGLGARMRAALYDAYWDRGVDIGRIDRLTEIGAAVGLDPEALGVVLGIDLHADQVARETAEARRLGIECPPALVIGGGADARLLIGGQSYAALRGALGHPFPS
ncbi:hypothetical protein BH23GEM4_BH23GEM4_11820 [soil metagenome]